MGRGEGGSNVPVKGICWMMGVMSTPRTWVASDRPVPSTMSPLLNKNRSFPSFHAMLCHA
eukprot:3586094-Rhodomonas_salina.3